MILSHRYHCIFIKTRKTAGTSLEVFLSQHCGEEDIVTPIQPHIEPHRARNHRGWFNPLPELLAGRQVRQTWRDYRERKRFYNHLPAWRVRARVPRRIWISYFKFCVERDPWDKMISHYHMLKYRAGGSLTWDEFFAKGDFPANAPLYTDARGEVLVDRVLRYEQLPTELGEVFGQLGIPFTGSLGVSAKSEYRADRRPASEVLTAAQCVRIAEILAPELRLHGYTLPVARS